MTTKEHIELLQHLSGRFSVLYKSLSQGTDYWKDSPLRERINDAIAELEGMSTPKLGAFSAIDKVLAAVETRGPLHRRRYDEKVAEQLDRGLGLYEAMAYALAEDDVRYGFGMPQYLDAMPKAFQHSYHAARKEAVANLDNQHGAD